MAEKITERKEYRGLGYAPSISVPGLVQTRPVAATRPPQTNELTKLAKSLGDFGETFANSQLRKAAIADDEAKQLAKEALSSVAMGGWVRGPDGKPVPKVSTTAGGISVGKDVRSLAFQGTDEDLSAAYAELGIPKAATPAFYAYLRRGMAESIASEFSTRLTARIKEAGRLGTVDGDVNNSQIIREISQEESEKIRKQFGDNWFLYAPEAVRKAEQQFTIEAQAQLLENREEEANESFKKNFSDLLSRADSIENLDEDLTKLIVPARNAGLPIKPLIAEASVSAVQKLLYKDTAGATATARILVEKLGNAVLNTASKNKPQDAASLLKGVNRKGFSGEEGELHLETLTQQALNWTAEDLPGILETLDQKADSPVKAATQQIVRNRMEYVGSSKGRAIPLLNQKAETILDDMLERAEDRDRANRENDIATLSNEIKQEMDAWSVSPEGRMASPDQAFAKMGEILSMSFSLGRMDADGNPIMASPSEFDKTIFRPDRWNDDVLNWRRVSNARGELNDWVDKSIRGNLNKLTSEGIEAAKAALENNRASFTTTQVQSLERAVKDAELVSEIDRGVGRERWADEVAGLTEILTTQAGLTAADLAGLPPTSAKVIALQRKKVDTLTKFRKQAQRNFRNALATSPERPDENTLREITNEAITAARETITKEITAVDAVAAEKKSFKEAEQARQAAIPGPWGPDFLARKGFFGFRKNYTGQVGLDRRSVDNMEVGRKLVAQVPGEGTLASRLAAMPNRARAETLGESLKKVAEEAVLIRDAAWHRRYDTTLRLAITNYDDDKERDQDIAQLRRDLIHTGVTPEEVISKTIWLQKGGPQTVRERGKTRQAVMLEKKRFGDEVALLNYATTPMFRDVDELLKLNNEEDNEDAAINKMIKSLGIDPALKKDFITTQLLLLQRRGGGKGILGKRNVKTPESPDMSGVPY